MKAVVEHFGFMPIVKNKAVASIGRWGVAPSWKKLFAM